MLEEVEHFGEIREFLAAVRFGARRRALSAVGRAAIAAIATLLLIAPLASAWARPAQAAGLRVWAMAALLLVVGCGTSVVILLWRRLAADGAVARLVGRARPELASDLLSVVELEQELGATGPARFSSELACAHARSTAVRVQRLAPLDLVPRYGRARATSAMLVAICLYGVVLAWSPGTIGRGWRLLAAPPSSSGTTVMVVPAPVVADLTLELTYPAYMGRAPRLLPSSSGDLRAPRGTKVAVTARAIGRISRAALLFDGEPESAARVLEVVGLSLQGHFVVERPGAYRFRVQPPDGRARVEAESRRIEVEPDRVPEVTLVAPADELDVSGLQQIELAFAVADDYGVQQVELVWQGRDGREHRRPLVADAPGRRSVDGRYLWDLADVALEPGERVAYHVEARDNDDVAGPNVGVSRTLHLRAYSPAERHAETLALHEAVLGQALDLVADRLVAAVELTVHRELHEATQRLVVELGRLAAAVADDTLAPRGLGPVLDAMHARQSEGVRVEQALLEKLDALHARTPGTPPRAIAERLTDAAAGRITELERDVLLLDDWLSRQRLEAILALTDDVALRRERLAAMLDELVKSGRAGLTAEIEHELRALERLEQRLAEQRGELAAEVADRFLHAESSSAPDVGCHARVRELLAAGQAAAARAELARCTERLDREARELESGLRAMRSERFGEEAQAYGALLDEVANLEEEQGRLAGEAEAMAERQRARIAEWARARQGQGTAEAARTLEQLVAELAAIPSGAFDEPAAEERESVKRRLEDVGRMLVEQDLAEARAMAEEAERGLHALGALLEDATAEGRRAVHAPEAAARVVEAQRLAQRLLDELDAATPSSEEVTGADERRRMGELKRRQESLRERGKKLAQGARKDAARLPGDTGRIAADGLDEAGQRMERGRDRFGAGDPRGAAEEARAAADRLSGMRRGVERAARPSLSPTGDGDGGTGMGRDRVRIPGRDEDRAPESYREEILDARRKATPPPTYREQIERYYEELTR